jgi:16S rRNA (guanine527-N7)-methyltransferase
MFQCPAAGSQGKMKVSGRSKGNPAEGPGLQQDFPERLLQLCSTHGIFLTDRQARLCYRHCQLMLHWNRRINLTRITSSEELLVKHLLDSLIPAGWLPQNGSALDVGTGAGFPGIPLKILNPNLSMVLLESQQRKISFLQVLLSQLALENLSVLHEKWENFERTCGLALLESFSLVTARAIKVPPAQFGVFLERVLRPEGVFACWAGPHAAPEWQRLDVHTLGEKFVLESHRDYQLPFDYGRRQLFIWKRYR